MEDIFAVGQSSELATSVMVTYIVIIVVGLVASFLLAIIPSKIAKKKGYSGVGFYWFGFAALIPAIIVASVLKSKLAPQEPKQPQNPGTYQS